MNYLESYVEFNENKSYKKLTPDDHEVIWTCFQSSFEDLTNFGSRNYNSENNVCIDIGDTNDIELFFETLSKEFLPRIQSEGYDILDITIPDKYIEYSKKVKLDKFRWGSTKQFQMRIIKRNYLISHDFTSVNPITLERFDTKIAASTTNPDHYFFCVDSIPFGVRFDEKNKGSYEISYGVLSDDLTKINFNGINKGNAFNIIYLVVECVKEFVIKNESVTQLEFQGIGEDDKFFNFISKLYGKNIIIDKLLEYIYGVFGNGDKTKRTHIFTRWAEREANKLNWKVSVNRNKVIISKI
jgi:hypothetical protein